MTAQRHVLGTQRPVQAQTLPPAQVPHVPPQPLAPHDRPEHWGVQAAVQRWSAPQYGVPLQQVPQLPPQPSLPQFLLVQSGWQAHSSV